MNGQVQWPNKYNEHDEKQQRSTSFKIGTASIREI